jgi:competence protein ComEA
MSFYRTILTAVAAVAIAAPAFADDAAMPSTAAPTNSTMQNQTAVGSTEAKINLNTATAKELLKVKGLNAPKARAIIAYRKKHGEFKSLDTLAKVKGFKRVKPNTMKEIQDQLTLE